MPLPEEFRELALRVRNWGRWGADDELGTLNLVTSEVRQRAASAVRSGRTLSLALPLSYEQAPGSLVPRRPNPLHTMLSVNEPMFGDEQGAHTSDDMVVMGLQCATHWDALSHVSYDGTLYNGFPASTVTTLGAARCGIDKVSSLVTRGVLLDVARARGVDRLEPGHAITAEDLAAAEELAGVRVEPGDAVLVRTGQVQLLHAGERVSYAYPSPGLSMASVPWLRDRDVAAVGTDNLTGEVMPGHPADVWLPVHLLHLVDMGLTQGQNFDLEALSADCADDGAYEFLLDASPLPIPGAVGSPINPIAVK